MEYNDKNLLDLYGQHLSYRDIARALHVTSSVVGGRIKRIKAKSPELLPERINTKNQHCKPVTKVKPQTLRAHTSLPIEIQFTARRRVARSPRLKCVRN